MIQCTPSSGLHRTACAPLRPFNTCGILREPRRRRMLKRSKMPACASANNGDERQLSATSRQRVEGQACLLLASLLWGSYSPALRLAYNLADPPSPVVLAAARGTLQLLLLLGPALLLGGGATWWPSSVAAAPPPRGSAGAEAQGAMQPSQPEESDASSSVEPGRDDEKLSQPLLDRQPLVVQLPPRDQLEPAGSLEPLPAAAVVVVEEEAGSTPARLPLGLPAPLLATLEIGLYNTTGTLAQTAGLELTSATRAAFLIQASILFTPVLAALAGKAPSRKVWCGSLLALVGTLLITLDHWISMRVDSLPSAAVDAATAASAPAAASPLGDALLLFAALCYSASTVRIPVWAVRHSVAPLQLALGKSAFLAVVSGSALGLAAVQLVAEGQAAAELWPGWRGGEGWALICWSALGPGALSAVLHVKGQQLLPDASKAQIIFCTVPFWSALIAALVLPGENEQIGLATWLGGGMIAAAGLFAGLPSRKRSAESSWPS